MDRTLVFRRASPVDHDDIYKLSQGVYDGTDYLSHIFLDLLVSPIWHVYVAADVGKGHIVALTCMLVADKRNTLIWRFSRVKPSHRGHKLIKLLKSFALKDVTSSTDMSLLQQKGVFTIEELTRNPNIICNPKILAPCEYCCFVVDTQAAKQLLPRSSKSNERMRQLDVDEIRRPGKFANDIRLVLPKGMIVTGLDCFTLMDMTDDEINYLRERQLGFLASNTLDNGTEFSNSLCNSPGIAHNEGITLSAVYWKPWKFNSNVWGILMSMHGCQENAVCCHISHVICKLLEIFKEETFIQVLVEFYPSQKPDGWSGYEAVKKWSLALNENWLTFTYCHEALLVESCPPE